MTTRLGRSLVNSSENFKDVVATTSLSTAMKKINAVFISSSLSSCNEHIDPGNVLFEYSRVKSGQTFSTEGGQFINPRLRGVRIN